MAAAGTAAAPDSHRPVATPKAVTDRHDEYVQDLLGRQVTDPSKPLVRTVPRRRAALTDSAAVILDAFTAAF